MTDRRKMLWYDKIIINLYIAKYIWGGDGNMKKKRIEQNEIKRYFLIIAAFLSFIILSLLFFLSWLQQDVEQRAVYFISEALVILLDRKNLVNNMHEAYAALKEASYPYGVFISGPSKTADIEQALVMGAHGARKVLVVLK